VAFDDGAAPEILNHEKTGLLVPSGDTAALADTIGRLAEAPDRARNLGEAARSAAVRYEPDIVAGEVDSLYEQVLEG